MVSEVFVERAFDPPVIDGRGLSEDPMAALPAACAVVMGAAAHRIEWRESFLDRAGRRVLWRFAAPDAESVRIALRQAGAVVERVWAGTVEVAHGPGAANVVGERSFEVPLAPAVLRSITEGGERWRRALGVRLLCTFLALDRRRLVSLYRAPDARTVRAAEDRAGAPLAAVWSCRWAALGAGVHGGAEAQREQGP